MSDWSAMVNTTISKYMKGASDLTLRERVHFAMLRRRARIFYNASGLNLVRRVKFDLPETNVYTGGVLDFQPSDKYRTLTLDWIGYKVTDTMDELETLKNRSTEAIINRYDTVARDMRQSLEDNFGTEIYNNGTTYPTRLWGLETPMTAGDCEAGDKIAAPNGSYCGKSTVPGAEGGTWSKDLSTYPNDSLQVDWPDGTGSTVFDYISPKLLNWSSTAWVGSGSTTWLETCERVIRQGVIWGSITGGKAGRPQVCVLSGGLYADYLNKQAAKQQIIVPHKELQDLGFEGAKQDGVSIVTEYGVPANTGYLINYNRMELHCMYKQLFAVRGPEWDIHQHAWLFAAGFFGQLYFEPKSVAKLYNYA